MQSNLFIKIPNSIIQLSEYCQYGLSTYLSLVLNKPFYGKLITTIDCLKNQQVFVKDLRYQKSEEYIKGLLFNSLIIQTKTETIYPLCKVQELQPIINTFTNDLTVNIENLSESLEKAIKTIDSFTLFSKKIIHIDYLENPSNIANNFTILTFKEYEDLLKSYCFSTSTKFNFTIYLQIYLYIKMIEQKKKSIINYFNNQNQSNASKSVNGITITKLVSFTQKTRPTVTSYLNTLEKNNFIKSITINNVKNFVLTDKYSDLLKKPEENKE